MRKLAAALGTDSSSLYRHFRNKTELLRAVADRILLSAMDGYRPEFTGSSASPPWPCVCARPLGSSPSSPRSGGATDRVAPVPG
ncbi:hypothetical protein STENM327S_05225 [Streptomyces tendae]